MSAHKAASYKVQGDAVDSPRVLDPDETPKFGVLNVFLLSK